MKRAALLLLLVSCATPTAAPPSPPGTAPDIRAPTLDGSRFVLHAETPRHPATLLSFGASWCQPCLLEWPVLAELAARHQPRGLFVVFVVFDEDPEALDLVRRFFYERMKIGFPAIVGDEEVARNYDVEQLPQVYLLDRHGRVVWREVGYKASTIETLEDRLDSMLDDKTGP